MLPIAVLLLLLGGLAILTAEYWSQLNTAILRSLWFPEPFMDFFCSTKAVRIVGGIAIVVGLILCVLVVFRIVFGWSQ